MTKFREELLDRMIKLYGFEHPLVIQFAQSCLCYTDPSLAPMWDGVLKTLVECHEANPYSPNEEEEDF